MEFYRCRSAVVDRERVGCARVTIVVRDRALAGGPAYSQGMAAICQRTGSDSVTPAARRHRVLIEDNAVDVAEPAASRLVHEYLGATPLTLYTYANNIRSWIGRCPDAAAGSTC